METIGVKAIKRPKKGLTDEEKRKEYFRLIQNFKGVRITKESLNTLRMSYRRMLGIDMEGGNISTHGTEMDIYTRNSKYVFSGHYHGKSLTEHNGCIIKT